MNFPMALLLLAARVVLAIVFAVAGFAKLANPKGTRAMAKDFGVSDALAGPFAVLLPIAELLCAVLLLPASTARMGAMATIALLAIFIFGISVSLARGKRPDCNCFGQIQSAPIGASTIVRNVVLAALGVFVIVQGDAIGQPGILGSGGRSDDSSLSVALFLIVALTAAGAMFMTYLLLRQNGRLALRIEALEARLGAEPVKHPGLPVDTPAPKFSVDPAGAEQVLLFFKNPGCSACDAMLPEVEDWQRQHQGQLRIVTVEDRDVHEAYLVDATPSAVLVNEGRVASPLATGADAIRELVKDATRPKPYVKGDLVAPLALQDLDDRTVDLPMLGRKTVLLFWSPTCGFCISALDDVKWWERHRDPELADMVVITSGDAAGNRAQGFQSRVVLDQDFAAGNRFGAAGTPSAVLIDEHGRVGSDVAVGAPEVLALAGSASPARRPATVS